MKIVSVRGRQGKQVLWERQRQSSKNHITRQGIGDEAVVEGHRSEPVFGMMLQR